MGLGLLKILLMKIRKNRGLLGFLLLILFIPIGKGYAERQTPAELLKDATLAMQEARLDDASALMYLYLDQVEESKAERVIQIAQDIRFKLATVLIQMERLDEAAFLLESYVSLPFATQPRQALKMIATCFYEISDYNSTVSAVSNALAYTSTAPMDASDSEKKIGDDEAPFTMEEKGALYLMQAEACMELEKWDGAVNAFEFVLEHAVNDQRKGYATMQLVNALIELRDFERITAWIPQLYRTDARYDIRVNLALLNAAAALYQAEEYASALPLYRMIIPKDELLSFQEEKLKTLRIEAGLPPELGAALTTDEMMLFGVSKDSNVELQVKDFSSGLLAEKPKALIEHEALLNALREMPPYEIDVDYRMADLYRSVERYWESVAFFERVFALAPESEIGRRATYEMVDVLLNELNEVDDAESRALAYIHSYPEGITPRQLAYMLNEYYQDQADMESVKGLKPYLDTFERTNSAIFVQYDAELYFMQAVADLVLLNYSEAEAGFKFVLDTFPESHQTSNSLYWYAMARLFLQNYSDAVVDFEKYLQRYPTEVYADECEFQVGVCLFGLERYDEAVDRFSRVIRIYKDSSVYPEACSMRGDIYGSRGLLDEAIADYKRAIDAAKSVGQATYPTFQMAEVFEAEDRYDRIVNCVELYLDQWGAEADIAKALFWIGKTKIQQKQMNEAIETYVDAIVTYGNDLQQEGVDLMVAELIKISKLYLDIDQQAGLKRLLRKAISEAESEVLSLRLRVALANLEGKAIALGAQFIRELPTFENASPPVLACICDASFDRNDFSRAEELLDLFMRNYSESDFLRAAFKLRTFGQISVADHEGALATIEEAQENYGVEYDMAWTQLAKAEALLELGRFDEAYEANLGVLNVRAWRGAPMAQATYQLGLVEEARGEALKAFGFYQRTYFQYKGHAGGYWAAEAYLASARCLEVLGLENDRRNTFRAMLFDPFVNQLVQADLAREILGGAEVAEIEAYIETGGVTNIAVEVDPIIIEGAL